MPNTKGDRQRVSSKQDYELDTLVKKWKIKRIDLLAIMKEIGPHGDPERSRDDIEAELVKRGVERKQKKQKDPVPPSSEASQPEGGVIVNQ